MNVFTKKNNKSHNSQRNYIGDIRALRIINVTLVYIYIYIYTKICDGKVERRITSAIVGVTTISPQKYKTQTSYKFNVHS